MVEVRILGRDDRLDERGCHVAFRDADSFLNRVLGADGAVAIVDARGLGGYTEIGPNNIVRDLLANPRGMNAVPRLSAEFLTNFDRFNLTAQEGYLISLIDGRMDLQKLLVLSPFDPFTTLFNLAKLQHERAITIPQ